MARFTLPVFRAQNPATVRPVKTRFPLRPLTVNLATKIAADPLRTQSHPSEGAPTRLYVHGFQVPISIPSPAFFPHGTGSLSVSQ